MPDELLAPGEKSSFGGSHGVWRSCVSAANPHRALVSRDLGRGTSTVISASTTTFRISLHCFDSFPSHSSKLVLNKMGGGGKIPYVFSGLLFPNN